MKNDWVTPEIIEVEVKETAGGGAKITAHDGVYTEIKTESGKILSLHEYAPEGLTS